VLFIVTAAAAIIGGTLMVLPVEEAGTFADITAYVAGVVSGVLIELLMVVAVIGIAVLFFPVLSLRQAGETGTKERGPYETQTAHDLGGGYWGRGRLPRSHPTPNPSPGSHR
jgi:hypothetical protein